MTSIVCWQKALAIKDTIVCSRLLSVLPSVSSLYFSPFFSRLSINDRSRSQQIAICSPVTIAVCTCCFNTIGNWTFLPRWHIYEDFDFLFGNDSRRRILLTVASKVSSPFLFFPNDNIFFLFYVKSTFLILLLPLIVCYRSIKSTLPLVIRHIGKFDGFL